MSDVKAVLTEALDGHWSVQVKVEVHDNVHVARHVCHCGGLYSSLAEHLVDVLLALPGVAVIQLPGPDHVAQGDEFENGRTEYALGDVSVFEDGEIHLFGATWQLSDVKTLAAALLAAAVLSEETTK